MHGDIIMPKGSGVLSWEIAMNVQPTMQMASATNSENGTHHRCKICGDPNYNGQKLGHFEGKWPFCTYPH